MNEIKKHIKAIIFDMDGTIVQTEQLWHKATRILLERRGYDSLNSEQETILSSLSGAGMEHAIQTLIAGFNLTDEPAALIKENQDLVAQLFVEYGTDFTEGFVEFHELIRKHAIPSAIATNADDASLTYLSETMKLRRFFGDHIYSISHVGNQAKPDPAIFLHAAEQIGVKPEECVVFEDSPAGIAAAKAAGMQCIILKNRLNEAHHAHVDGAVDHFHDALETLRTIVKKKDSSS